jgi:hypothetical protein
VTDAKASLILFEVMNVVNMSTVDNLLHIPAEIKSGGVFGLESVGAIASIRPSQSSAVEVSRQEIP